MQAARSSVALATSQIRSVGPVSEVKSTLDAPWRGVDYLLAFERIASIELPGGGNGGFPARFETAKAFHVSPFLPMETHYRWRFTAPGSRLLVHLRNDEARGHAFDATLSLERREITGRSLAAALARFPFMTLRVVALIYWQALKLKLKGAVFHPHPGKREAELEKP